MARDIYGNPILRYGQGSPIIPSTVRLTQSPAANPYDPRATYQGDLQTELGVFPQAQRPMVSPVLGRPSVAREGAIMRGAMTPAQRSAMATKALAETARERAIRESAMGAAQQQRPKGFFDSLPSPMSPAGQALGAFGTTALQLSGYQDRPITLGAGLGAAVQAAQKAYTSAEEREEAKALSSAQRKQDLMLKMLEIQAQQAKTLREGGKEIFGQEKDLRKEFDVSSKPFKETMENFNKSFALATKENPTGASDIALVFAFMKTLDPRSVVREGEQATAEKAGGVPATIRNFYNKLLTGERFDPRVRDDIVGAASTIVLGQIETQRELEEKYQRLSDSYGLNASNVYTSLLPKQGSFLNPTIAETKDDFDRAAVNSYVKLPDGSIVLKKEQ